MAANEQAEPAQEMHRETGVWRAASNAVFSHF
jgi:hypothetical protein